MSEFIQNTECAIHIETDICTPDHIIHKATDHKHNSIHESLEELKKKTNCTTEFCVVKSDFFNRKVGNGVVKHLLDNYFKIEGPKCNIKKWLSNLDIDNTLKQWTLKFKDFYPIPFQMRDFKEKNTEFCTIDFVKLYKEKYKTFACVPNTDWSSGKGKHWFAIFLDFRKAPFTIEYFNSSGELPLKEYNEWMNEMEENLQKEFGIKVKKIIVSRIQHQYDGSSCGCYALYYIFLRLQEIPYETFSKTRIPDEKMYEFRPLTFNSLESCNVSN